MRNVDGQKDPVMKLLRELHNEAGRRREGRFFVEGPDMTMRAFEYGGDIECVILADRFTGSPEGRELIDIAEAAGKDVFLSSAGLLAKMLDAKPASECVAIARRKVVSFESLIEAERPLVLMVEKGDNADNLGMLIRSTDGVGVTGVVLTSDTTDPFSRRAVRGSRGAVFTVPLCFVGDACAAADKAKVAGLKVIGTSANKGSEYTSVDYTGPAMIAVGNEHTGMTAELSLRCDEIASAQMQGQVNSLNIAVAASIILFEAVRQRRTG